MAQQQKSPHEEMILAVVVVGLLCGIGFVIWFFFHQQLTEMLRWIRVGQLWIDRLIVGDDYTIVYGEYGEQNVGAWRRWLPDADIREITTREIAVSTALAVPPLRPLFCILIGLMGLVVLFFGPGSRYRRHLNLETLMKEQARSFPTITPFLKFNPLKLPFRAPGQPVPGQLPLFAEALAPEEWLAFHEVAVTGTQIDANKAYQALALQLGRRWKGPLALPIYAQGLFAAFALKHVRKRKECTELLNQLAISWSADRGFHPSLKLRAYIRKVIKDPKLGGALQKHADQHAFETTALLRALSRAREEGGVLAPAEFVWLRGQDRNLWYPLQNLGRKSYHAEAAGALVHYTNEVISKQKIPTPQFDEVVRGYETILKSPGARAVPPLDKKAKHSKYWKEK